MKVITFSRQFPKKHPKAGEHTFFVEKIWKSVMLEGGVITQKIGLFDIRQFKASSYLPKMHTIRNGYRWKVGEHASLRIWSGVAYRSPQIEFAQVQIKKIWLIKIRADGNFVIRHSKKSTPVQSNMYKRGLFTKIARNDGFDNKQDLKDWIDCHPKKKKGKYIFEGQIICWSDKINY